jgi:hypothetical protein
MNDSNCQISEENPVCHERMEMLVRVVGAMLVAAVMFITGCTRDVTYSTEYGFARVAGHYFMLKDACYVYPQVEGKSVEIYGHGFADYTGPFPSSWEEYQSEFKKHNELYLAAGTKIRIEKLLWSYMDSYDKFEVFGHIISGPLAGTPAQIINFVSARRLGVCTYELNFPGDVFIECDAGDEEK